MQFPVTVLHCGVQAGLGLAFPGVSGGVHSLGLRGLGRFVRLGGKGPGEIKVDQGGPSSFGTYSTRRPLSTSSHAIASRGSDFVVLGHLFAYFQLKPLSGGSPSGCGSGLKITGGVVAS